MQKCGVNLRYRSSLNTYTTWMNNNNHYDHLYETNLIRTSGVLDYILKKEREQGERQFLFHTSSSPSVTE